MTLTKPRARLLRALFDLTQEGEEIDILTLSEEAGLSVYRALTTLTDLDSQGLVSARRLRLTFRGLAVAAALGQGEHQQEAACLQDAEPSVRPVRAAGAGDGSPRRQRVA